MQRPKVSTSQSTPKRKRKPKSDTSYPKITEYLSPKNATKSSKFEPLDVTVTSTKPKKSKRKSQKTSSGIVIPSYEKILADQKMFAEHKAKVQMLDVFDEKLLDEFWIDYKFTEKEFSGELLDCQSLSKKELEDAFEKHVGTLEGILKGTVFSERHQCYHKPQNEQTLDLRTSNSTAVFTADQNEFLLDVITKRLDPEDKLVGYCFKVLWPELCLRIFMDHHDMRADEAEAYLEKRPLDF